jgi:hypothetical protein
MYSWVLENRNLKNYDRLYDLTPSRFDDEIAPIFNVALSSTL